MRKIVYNSLLPESGESLLANFQNQKLAAQFSDTRERASLHAFKVGHPQGMVDVPGKRGWIYMQRMLPDGSSTTLQCFVPSNASGKTHIKFKPGQVIDPKPTSDTNPTYWVYEGIPSTPATRVQRPTGSCGSGSCAITGWGQGYVSSGTAHQVLRRTLMPIGGGEGVYQNIKVNEPPDYIFGTNPDDVSDLGIVTVPFSSAATQTAPNGAGNQDPDAYYNNQPPASDLPSTYPVAQYDPESDPFSGIQDPKVTPIYSVTPPISPGPNALWYDGTFTRRWMSTSGNTSVNGWKIVSGPRPGSYEEHVAGENLNYGDVVGFDPTNNNNLQKATSTATAIPYGVVVRPALNNKVAVIQTSGNFKLVNSFSPGTQLYVDVNGTLTDTIPYDHTTGGVIQPMAVAVSDEEILIQPQPAITEYTGYHTYPTSKPIELVSYKYGFQQQEYPVVLSDIPMYNYGTSAIPDKTFIAIDASVTSGFVAMILADGSSSNPQPTVGVTVGATAGAAGSTAAEGRVRITGYMPYMTDSAGTAIQRGKWYYLDPANPGKVTSVAPTTTGQVKQAVGWGADIGVLVLNIRPAEIVGSGSSGGGGSSSSSVDFQATATNDSGATIAAYTPVHLYTSGSTVLMRPAQAGADPDFYPATAFTTESVLASSSGTIQFGSKLSGFTGLTPGHQYLDPATAGALTTSPGTTTGTRLQRVGFAPDTTSLIINIELPIKQY